MHRAGEQQPDARGPSDGLVLAAIERAILHDRRGSGAVTVASILEHLGARRRSGDARHLRLRLALLDASGWLERSRRHGVARWALAEPGRRYLARARKSRRPPRLPESPQHRAWRDARRLAAGELERFRANLDARLERAARLSEAAPATGSDSWFELGEDLRRACWRVGSATHCLHEWHEPDDAHADLDERSEPGDERLTAVEYARVRARRQGRRNTRLW